MNINNEEFEIISDAAYLLKEIDRLVPDNNFSETVIVFNAEILRNVLIMFMNYVKDKENIDIFTILEILKAEERNNGGESSSNVH